MIRKVEMYQAVCDGCGRKGACYPSRKACMHMVPLAHRWYEIDGKLYCPDCVEWDKETESYKPKKEETMNSIWIAREKDGLLYAYKSKPFFDEDKGEWCSYVEGCLSRYAYRLSEDWFPDLTFENSPLELVPKGTQQ